LVLDAGAGLVNLDPILRDRPFEGTILPSHLRWDHTHGLPSFRNAALPVHQVRIVLPEQRTAPQEAPGLLPAPLSGANPGPRDNGTFVGIEPGA
jgi:phosphoribosyl 1,2-cyclic phosphodiesterase